MSGIEGKQHMARMLDALRKNPPRDIGGLKVTSIEDLRDEQGRMGPFKGDTDNGRAQHQEAPAALAVGWLSSMVWIEALRTTISGASEISMAGRADLPIAKIRKNSAARVLIRGRLMRF